MRYKVYQGWNLAIKIVINTIRVWLYLKDKAVINLYSIVVICFTNVNSIQQNTSSQSHQNFHQVNWLTSSSLKNIVCMENWLIIHYIWYQNELSECFRRSLTSVYIKMVCEFQQWVIYLGSSQMVRKSVNLEVNEILNLKFQVFLMFGNTSSI